MADGGEGSEPPWGARCVRLWGKAALGYRTRGVGGGWRHCYPLLTPTPGGGGDDGGCEKEGSENFLNRTHNLINSGTTKPDIYIGMQNTYRQIFSSPHTHTQIYIYRYISKICISQYIVCK